MSGILPHTSQLGPGMYLRGYGLRMWAIGGENGRWKIWRFADKRGEKASKKEYATLLEAQRACDEIDEQADLKAAKVKKDLLCLYR